MWGVGFRIYLGSSGVLSNRERGQVRRFAYHPGVAVRPGGTRG